MKRLMAVLMVGLVVLLTGCYTTSATDETENAATYHGKAKCYGGGPEGHGYIFYARATLTGAFARVSPEYRFDCAAAGNYGDMPAFRDGGLSPNTAYRYRIGYRLDRGDTGWFDSQAQSSGTNYTQFETDGAEGGEVGGEGSATDATASVDADRLCRWTDSYHWNNYYTSQPKAGGWIGCNSDVRKVDIGCSLTLYYTGGQNDTSDGLGTGHTTSCAKSLTAPVNTKMKTMRWAFSVRLQNSERTWRKTFRSGDSIDCTTDRDTEHRDVMHCVRYEYNPRLPTPPG